ncbi:hypothetical protein HIM_09822 [Hirsutella minnesotensis 3608]|uniref:CHAT domain-containing protein n=1 Tax=Hirsutella minnesotensis 3608 TaxID=1043627 RepID=A0A0F8A2W9_9HYPO|nr:hypothetical protein HIM_09822 [Hirsutella minnesotensis 3608]
MARLARAPPCLQVLDRAARLNNLGNWLGMRFKRTGSMDDLDRAIEVADMAVAATPQGHPDRARQLSNLGTWLGSRFERTGSMNDLDRAVEVADVAVAATPQDHPDRAALLNNLGNILGRRFERTGSINDLDRALSSYKEGWRCEVAPPSRRIHLAWKAAHILTRRLNWDESSQLMEEAVRLLPTVSPRSLQNADKQHMLSDFAGLASMAAATALNAKKEAHHALELLELGRGVIAGLLLEMRTDVSDLEQQHPGLATEFMSLRDELDTPVERTILLASDEHARSLDSQAKRRLDAEKQFNKIIKKIRTQPGFQNFLRPPTADQLMAAADQAPIVVVNADSLRCDAFIVDRYHIEVLHLPNLRLEHVEASTKFLRTSEPSLAWLVLAWVWVVAACPILDSLGINQPSSDDSWPHVCWVLTGRLSQLPFHAAGLHLEGSGDTVLDRVISSYSTSVKALLHGRRHSHQELNRGALENALLIAMEKTPGQSDLRFARQEMEELCRLCPSLNLNPITPPPHREDVLAHLRSCKIFHFAGHGKTDAIEPSKNSLLLEDWEDNPLTVKPLSLLLEHVEASTKFLRTSEPSLAWLVLAWVWVVAACPILDSLGINQPSSDDSWPHVCWVLTGRLSQLPFHAAGLHLEGSGDTVLDRVISSYSTSVKALLHGRRHSHQELNRGALENALLIAMEKTPGQSDLRFARQEMEELCRLCPSLNLNPITPPPHREDVLAHLRSCKIFHFAGHGKTDAIEPSKNSLLLEDWEDNPLTVADLRDYRLQETSPFLAYLSACSTGANEVEGLAEETIHLISACQLAGFRHVVGTLWEVRDEYCVDVATVLYETLRDEGITDRAIARGLHRAVRALRGRESGNSGRRYDSDPAVIQDGTHNSVDVDDLGVVLQDGNLAALEEVLRKGRNVVKCGGNHGKRQESPLSWASYVHFGVLTEVSKGPRQGT